MKGFDAIELEWDGETYSVPAERQLELIMRVEDGLIAGRDRQAFEVLIQRSGPPVALIGKVYADALAYAGANVPAIEVVRTLQDAIRRVDAAIYVKVANKLSEILSVIEAPADAEKGKSPGKAKGSEEAS